MKRTEGYHYPNGFSILFNDRIQYSFRSRLWRVNALESLGSPEQKNQLTLLATLFGNPGPADWKQANTNFLALKDTISRVNENSETQHSDNDMNRHDIEKPK
jgi:hypothetical protein